MSAKIKFTVTFKNDAGKTDRQWFRTATALGAAVAKLAAEGRTVHIHQGELG